MGGCWYCAFFDEGTLHKRLPRRLTFRNRAKVYETARRGHAHLEDPAELEEFELALTSGCGKICLELTREQRAILAYPTAA
jgi:hypothetical protein